MTHDDELVPQGKTAYEGERNIKLGVADNQGAYYGGLGGVSVKGGIEHDQIR